MRVWNVKEYLMGLIKVFFIVHIKLWASGHIYGLIYVHLYTIAIWIDIILTDP